MTQYSLIVSIVSIVASFFIALLSLAWTGYQFRVNYLWNKKKATMDALLQLYKNKGTGLASKHFNLTNNSLQYSIEEILKKFNETPGLQVDLHRLLNKYEQLALGVECGVFDEDMVKSKRKTMDKLVFMFRQYIDYRRQTAPTTRPYRRLESLTNRWRDLDR